MSRVTLRRVAAAGLGVAVGLGAFWLASSRSDGLAWTGPPQVYRVPGLSTDRVLAGEVINRSADVLYVDARRVAVVDVRGRRLETAARFLNAFVHPLYAPLQFPGAGDALELQRLGVYVRIEPGQRLPLTVSWRSGAPHGAGLSVDLGAETLSIPVG
jgi:hypothetical protein